MKSNDAPRPRNVALVLTSDSSLHSSLLAVEPFRAANRLGNQSHYSVDILSPDGAPILTSLQILVQVTASFQSDTRYDLVLVAISYEPSSAFKRKLFPWLRRQAPRQLARTLGITRAEAEGQVRAAEYGGCASW